MNVLTKTVFLLALLLAPGSASAAGGLPAHPLLAQAPVPRLDTCRGCHLDKVEGKEDIHAQKGISCTSCHGGDSSIADMAAMSPATGFRKISRKQIPELCGRCHSDAAFMRNFAPQMRVDQLALYRTSVHGKKLAQGQLNVATCVDCHGVHDIRPVRDPRSSVFPIHQPGTCGRCHTGAERKEYEQSVHWELLSKNQELSAPACATCHGSHGAAPPNVSSVAAVCGTCHALVEDLFQKSAHGPVFSGGGLRGCAECHSNHRVLRTSDAMLGDQKGAVCLNCHSAGDAGLQLARSFSEQLTSMKKNLADAENLIHRAEIHGMEVSEARLELGEANQALVQTRVLVHGLDRNTFGEQVRKGQKAARSVAQQGVAALQERDVRRRGLLVSLAAILVTLIGLYLTIRTIENNHNHPAS